MGAPLIARIDALIQRRCGTATEPPTTAEGGGLAAATHKPKKAPAHVTGRMNQTEQRFARQILDPRQADGTSRGYLFEQLKFRLATGTWYTVDFCELLAGGGLLMHEVKGRQVWEDSLVKFKVAAEQFPQWGWKLWQWADAQWKVVHDRGAPC